MQFTSTTSQHHDAVIVHPAGEVDRDTAEELIAALTGAVDRAGPGGSVEVDLTGISFLDSSGVGALLAGRQYAGEHDARYHVRDAQPDVRRILDITNVWRLLGPA